MVAFSDSVSLQIMVDGRPLGESNIGGISERTDNMGSTFRFAYCRIQPPSEKNFSIIFENKETATTSFLFAGMDGLVLTYGYIPAGSRTSRMAVSGVAKDVPSNISLRFPSSEIMKQYPHEIRVCVGLWRTGCRGMTLLVVRFLFGKGNEIQVEPVQESEFRLMARAQGLVDLTSGPNVGSDIVQPDYMGRWIESLEFKLNTLQGFAQRYHKGEVFAPFVSPVSVARRIARMTKLWYPPFTNWKWLLKPESVA